MRRDAYLDEGMQRWIEKTAREQLWRAPAWYGMDDLVQDGYVCYCKCRDRYALRPPDPGHSALNTDNPTTLQRRHFMSLVKMAFENYIKTLSTRTALCIEDTFTATAHDDADEANPDRLLPPEPEVASLLLMLSKAPAEIRELIDKLAGDAVDAETFVRSRLRRQEGRVRLGRRRLRETTREMWQRVLGDADLPDTLVAYLNA